MNKKALKFTLLVLIFIGLLSGTTSLLSSARRVLDATDGSYSDIMSLKLFDGSYGDYDGDGNEDDVRCYLNVTVTDAITRKKYEMYIDLILPNGDVWSYGYRVLTFSSEMTFEIIFWNHAYTPGDYEVSVHFYLMHSSVLYDHTNLIFDPPTEEEPDAEPFVSLIRV